MFSRATYLGVQCSVALGLGILNNFNLWICALGLKSHGTVEHEPEGRSLSLGSVHLCHLPRSSGWVLSCLHTPTLHPLCQPDCVWVTGGPGIGSEQPVSSQGRARQQLSPLGWQHPVRTEWGACHLFPVQGLSVIPALSGTDVAIPPELMGSGDWLDFLAPGKAPHCYFTLGPAK